VSTNLRRVSIMLTILLLAAVSASADDRDRDVLVLTSTNNPTGNEVVVFKLNRASATPSLPFVATIPTGGNGGASGNAGILQFQDELGAVANFGSNTVSQLARDEDSIRITQTIKLSQGCTSPDSVALRHGHLFVVGKNCAESHAWPWGFRTGNAISLTDPSAAQIVAGETWAAVTFTSGSVLQLPLTEDGTLNGISRTITLPNGANNTPLGAGFWGNVLGFTPAHSPHSFAIVDPERNVFPILGPQPSYPSNAPCWVAKGPGSVWYTGNSPGHAISIFFTDGQGGKFYKSVSLPGVPTDVTVSRDRKWLAVIYTATDNSGARIAVFTIDAYGDLSLAATSDPIGVAAFNGVAISQ
jgi:hypothetical protein